MTVGPSMTPEIIAAISGVITVVVTAVGVGVAWVQLHGIKTGLNISSLMAVLAIETQMNDRKVQLDEQCATYRLKIQENLSSDIIKIYGDLFHSAKENYFNALDRLCFCILKEYVKGKDWRAEYRNVLKNCIEAHPDDFNEASQFRNIKKLNNQWQDN